MSADRFLLHYPKISVPGARKQAYVLLQQHGNPFTGEISLESVISKVRVFRATRELLVEGKTSKVFVEGLNEEESLSKNDLGRQLLSTIEILKKSIRTEADGLSLYSSFEDDAIVFRLMRSERLSKDMRFVAWYLLAAEFVQTSIEGMEGAQTESVRLALFEKARALDIEGSDVRLLMEAMMKLNAPREDNLVRLIRETAARDTGSISAVGCGHMDGLIERLFRIPFADRPETLLFDLSLRHSHFAPEEAGMLRLAMSSTL